MQGATAILVSAAADTGAVARLAEGAPASSSRVPRVAVLGESNPISWMLRSGSVELECRWAESDGCRMSDLAAELVSLAPDVIVAVGPRASRAASTVTALVPIVVVADSMVFAEAARSRGNVAGVLVPSDANLASQRLGLLLRVVPHVRKVGVLLNPDNTAHEAARGEIDRVTAMRGIESSVVNAQRGEDLAAGLARLRAERVGAIIVLPDALFSIHRLRIVELGNEMGLPGLYPSISFTQSGGLMSLCGNSAEIIRRTGSLIQSILVGADPASLPIARLDRLELSINRVTASALGLEIAPSLLARADTIITSAGAVPA